MAKLIAEVWTARRLLWALAVRDVAARYRGSTLGMAWAFMLPLMMMSVYVVFFTVVIRARWGLKEVDQTDFAILMFIGLLTHTCFSECLTRAPYAISGQVSFVKKVVFPLPVLPLVPVMTALFTAAISLALVIIALVVIVGGLPWTAVLLPVVWLPFVVMMAGVTLLLGGVGVYLRDINQLTSLASAVLLFASPIFYPIEAAPPLLRSWLWLNPLTLIIEDTRQVLFHGTVPEAMPLIGYGVVALAVLALGAAAFRRLRSGFADVL